MNESEASLVIRAGAELLRAASSDPRSNEGYREVKTSIATALDNIAAALYNFEAAVGTVNRSTGWVQDLSRVADDLRDK